MVFAHQSVNPVNPHTVFKSQSLGKRLVRRLLDGEARLFLIGEEVARGGTVT
jgi:hypothetical protein